MEPELFKNPIPASHDRYLQRQLLGGKNAAGRRANRYKRRTEGLWSSRSSLALSELVNDVDLDEGELDRLKHEQEAAELQQLANVAATEVGPFYFMGELGLLERWSDDFEASILDLIQRQTERRLCWVHWGGAC